MYFATHEKNSLGELWNDRSDWWPQYHFRQDLVPSKDQLSETDWQLAQHKADAARWLLGKSMVTIILFELTSSLIFKKWLLTTMSTLKFDII